jgi:type VI secretion system protein ImpB
MPKESINKKIDRNNPARVHIEIEVETNGAIQVKELPFVAGVLADLSGDAVPDPAASKKPKFVEIDRDNFDKVMTKMAPRLVLKVDDKINNDDTKIPVELKFRSMEDFEPQKIAEQVEPLRMLLEIRKKLANLRSNLDGNEKLTRLLQKIVEDQDEREKLRAEIAGRPLMTGKED